MFLPPLFPSCFSAPDSCKFLTDAARATLVKGTAWTRLKCPHCMRSCSAAKWLCPCGVSWHICKDHTGPGFVCGSKPRFKKAPKARAAKVPIVAALGSQCAAPKASYAGLRPPRALISLESELTRFTRAVVICLFPLMRRGLSASQGSNESLVVSRRHHVALSLQLGTGA